MSSNLLMESLQAVRLRAKRLTLARGAGLVLATAMGLLVATVLLDYILNLPAVPRIIVMLGALAVFAYAVARLLLQPGFSRLTLSDIAGRLEAAFPQFDDRLRSTVDFLGSQSEGSAVMKERVVEQATTLASRIDLKQAVASSPAWKALSGGGATVIAVIVLAVMAGGQLRSIAFDHLFNPFANNPWPKRVQITSESTLPTRVPVGQRLDVRMRLTRGDKASMKPIVCYQYDNGPIEQEFMTRGDSGEYAASLDARSDPGKAGNSLKVWMKAGDDRLDLSAITVVPRLAVKSVNAVITPPAYVANGLPTTVNLSSTPAVMAVGSTVELQVAFNKPLAGDGSVKVDPVESGPQTTQPTAASVAPNITWSRGGDLLAVGRFSATAPIRFHLHATDADGFSNTALEEYELIVRPDQSPSVQIENPRRNEERTPVATIPLQAVAEDDYGISTLKLIVDRLNRGGDSKQPPTTNGDVSHWEIPLVDNATAAASVAWNRVDGTGERLRYRMNFGWDLSQLKDADLRGGDLLEYSLQVTDNFNLNGQTHPAVASGKLRISIVTQEDLASHLIAELQQVKNQVTDVKAAQSRTAQETTNLAEDTKAKPIFDQADHVAVQRLTGQQSSAAGETKQLAAKIEDIGKRLDENKSPAQDLKDLTRDVANDLNGAAEQPMKQATSSLTESEQAKATDKRNANLEDAKKAQTDATDDLQRAMDRMGNIGSLQQTIARINDLLKQQQAIGEQTKEAGKDNLGKRPEEMSPKDRDKLDAAAAAQAKLADATAKAMEEMKKAAEQLAKSDPAAAEAMSKAAETAKQQQVTPNQQKAAQQAKQNQQASAQSSQKQVELGLQMILGDLQQAERRKLEQLSKQLEQLQAQIANLIRRQANHNLDNVTVQGPPVVAKLDPKVLADLTALSERDPAQPPPAPQADRLAPSQEQTERNTRDISKAAESVPNGAEPASQLLRAADHMERAIVSLRDAKFAEAYDPPQVEALASLQSAKKVVDEQKKKVDNQLNEGEKEAVRQKYIKIRGDQDKLNAETNRIETARDPQGGLKRMDAIRLGQLPGEQGKLADQIAAIDEDLAQFGSIVYTWANRDIHNSMSDAKEKLGSGLSDSATQAEQARVVAQLDAMIQDLMTKPKESKFAAEGSPMGGGGSGKIKPPPLPTEAELRLMRDLQVAVNKNTQTLDQQQKKDQSQLLALGTRQGEMRGLLDQLFQKASQGQLKLGPEPDNRDSLPEEAKQEDVENNELDKNLLDDKADAAQEEKQAGLVGDRMARSRQRLALNDDPGKITQLIQSRILDDMDVLIDQARKQQAETRNPPPPPPGGGQKQPQSGDQTAKADNQGNKPNPNPGMASNPAQASRATAPGNANADLSKEIKESLAEWGQITPRLRQAQIEGSSETIVEQYRKLTEDYYRSLATKATQR